MNSRKIFGPFGVLILLATGFFLLLSSCSKEEAGAVQCIPNDDISEIRVVSNDAVIQKIELLENDGVLCKSEDPATYIISANKNGSAYIAVYYLNHQGEQDFAKFEIVSSPPISLVILQYDSTGAITGVYAY